MPYRVIVWGSGFVGSMVLREILDHPDYELAGVIVNDPAKHGRDAGELAGCDPVGIAATTDVDAALAVPADAVAYYGPRGVRGSTRHDLGPRPAADSRAPQHETGTDGSMILGAGRS